MSPQIGTQTYMSKPSNSDCSQESIQALCMGPSMQTASNQLAWMRWLGYRVAVDLGIKDFLVYFDLEILMQENCSPGGSEDLALVRGLFYSLIFQSN